MADTGFDSFPITPAQPFDNQQHLRVREHTLDEPVTTTLWRDAKLVGEKIGYVLVPRRGNNILKDWDLWGPLLLCLILAGMLSAAEMNGSASQSAIVFSGVFVIVWCGAGVVTVNSKLLGSHLSFLQSVCVLGYCIFPLVCAEVVTLFVRLWYVNLVVVVVAFAWSTYASLIFLSDPRLENRRVLAVYPILLFYFAIAWIILIF